MASLVRRLAGRVEERDDSSILGFQDWVNLFNFNGVNYPVGFTQTLTGEHEAIRGDYGGLISGAYASNGIVFACMLTRMLHFTEARFQWQQIRSGRPGNLFGTADLGILEAPWPNGTTRDLLARMIQDVDLAGNSYTLRLSKDRLFRLRPDWVEILMGSSGRRADWEPGDPDTEVIGYVYYPGGKYSGREEILYPAAQVAHFAPVADPLAFFRGMSWLTPVLRDIMADQAMVTHRRKFMENGATVNMVVKVPAETIDKFNEWVRVLRAGHEGVNNAYKMMFLGSGADVTPVGADMRQLDFKVVQGAGEVRIAAAARIPATLLGISEGLQGSTLNAGNYQSARRNFADGLLRPMWGAAAGALASILTVPAASRLWYDTRDIAFLKEDVKDAADVRQADASTVKSLIDAGYEPDAIIDAVTADDFSRLVGKHTGLFSVQLQQPGSGGTADNAASLGTAA